MKFLTTLAALTLSAAALTAAEPEPRFFNPAQGRWAKSVDDRLAALEAQPHRPQAAPAAAMPPAPAVNAYGAVIDPAPEGYAWSKAGTLDSLAPWGLVPVAAVPASARPVRDLVRSFAAPPATTCSGPNCPQPAATGRVIYRR